MDAVDAIVASLNGVASLSQAQCDAVRSCPLALGEFVGAQAFADFGYALEPDDPLEGGKLSGSSILFSSVPRSPLSPARLDGVTLKPIPTSSLAALRTHYGRRDRSAQGAKYLPDLVGAGMCEIGTIEPHLLPRAFRQGTTDGMPNVVLLGTCLRGSGGNIFRALRFMPASGKSGGFLMFSVRMDEPLPKPAFYALWPG